MDETLTVVLVALVAALGGGTAGALVSAFALKGEDKRWASKVAGLQELVEDLEGRWLSWQRRANKRTRDAVEQPRSDDLPFGKGNGRPRSPGELMAEARRRGILR